MVIQLHDCDASITDLALDGICRGGACAPDVQNIILSGESKAGNSYLCGQSLSFSAGMLLSMTDAKSPVVAGQDCVQSLGCYQCHCQSFPEPRSCLSSSQVVLTL